MIPSASLDLVCLIDAGMELSVKQAAELRELTNSREVPADIATRARIVLWSGEGRRRKEIAELLGVSLPTVDRWKTRYARRGLAGLEGDRLGGAREQVADGGFCTRRPPSRRTISIVTVSTRACGRFSAAGYVINEAPRRPR